MPEKPADRHPATTNSLLEALKDPARDAVWHEFDGRYRPVITAFARSLGLTPTDAEEVAQETLTEFLRCYREGKYDKSKGRLSSWIISIGRNRIADRRRVLARRGGQRGESAMENLRNRTRLTQVWEAERQRAIFAKAWEQMRASKAAEKTLRAFELVAMRGAAPEAAAKECGMTVEEVYVARARVTKKMREIVAEMTKAYTEGE